MKRMWSKEEFTEEVKKDVTSGILDEAISNAIEDYLEENPIDITALEGQDVELNSLDADNLITGAEIVEKMSGYSVQVGSSSDTTIEPIYISVCKNGNKITFVVAVNVTFAEGYFIAPKTLASFTIPSAIGSKLYPVTVGVNTPLAVNNVYCVSSLEAGVNSICYIGKSSNTLLHFVLYPNASLIAGTKYYIRYEQTFLLNDSLVSNA